MWYVITMNSTDDQVIGFERCETRTDAACVAAASICHAEEDIAIYADGIDVDLCHDEQGTWERRGVKVTVFDPSLVQIMYR